MTRLSFIMPLSGSCMVDRWMAAVEVSRVFKLAIADFSWYAMNQS